MIIVEAIDRLGKTSFTKNIQEIIGATPVVHCEKPIALDIYRNDLKLYQEVFFDSLMKLSKMNLILDRSWIGEAVYGPLYRNTDADYIFEMEKHHDLSDATLVLLYTSDFSFIEDDGESFNFSAMEKEQDLFLAAFEKTSIPNKIKIDVCNGQSGYKSYDAIIEEYLSAI